MRVSPAELAEAFELLRGPDVSPRYNIAPTQPVAAVRRSDRGREPAMLRWGLVPSWSKDPSGGARMINARAETLAERPAFRTAFRRRRCLVLADGFYEWKQTGGKKKQPFYITLRDGRPFAFAGLWEHWQPADGEPLESCTIVTTDANDLLRGLHDRMPVILHGQDYDRWLDPGRQDEDELQSLLVSYPPDEMQFRPVSTVVNSPRFDGPECIAPVSPDGDEEP